MNNICRINRNNFRATRRFACSMIGKPRIGETVLESNLWISREPKHCYGAEYHRRILFCLCARRSEVSHFVATRRNILCVLSPLRRRRFSFFFPWRGLSSTSMPLSSLEMRKLLNTRNQRAPRQRPCCPFRVFFHFFSRAQTESLRGSQERVLNTRDSIPAMVKRAPVLTRPAGNSTSITN